MSRRVRCSSLVIGVSITAACSVPASPNVDRSVQTPLLDPTELREIYDDSMAQLRDCIDDRRSDPASDVERFPC